MSSVLFRFNSGLKTKALNFIKSSNSYDTLRCCSTKAHLNVQVKETTSKTLPPKLVEKISNEDIYSNNNDENISNQHISKVDDLLPTSVASLSFPKALKLLTKVSKYCNESQTPFPKEHIDKLKGACDIIQKKVPMMSGYVLVDCLRSLLTLQVQPDSRIFQKVENEILWKMKSTNLHHLTLCLTLYQNNDLLKSRANFVKPLITTIESRIFEVTNTKDVMRLISKHSFLSKEFLGEVEGKALELLPKMNISELLQMFTFIKESKARCLPLIRGLSYYINKNLQTLTSKHCLELLSAIQVIQFTDYPLLNRISDDLLVNVSNLPNPRLISALLLIGQLRWNHKDLIGALSERVEEIFDQLNFEELCCFVTTFSILDYKPENGDKLLTKIEELALKRAGDKPTSKMLNLVWNLAILGHDKLLPHVLNPSFYAPILAESDSFSELSQKMKVLQLNAFNQIYLSQKSILDESFVVPEIPQSSLDQHLNTNVLSVLKGLIPDSNKLATKLDTKMGFLILAEFIANQEGKILPLLDYGTQAGIRHSGLKPLPDQCSRIALITATYKDYTLHSEQLLGLVRWKQELLTKAGYKVILVSYKDFLANNTLDSRLAYLKSKLKQAPSNV